MAYYAQLLIDKCIQTDSVSEDEKQQYILNKKLDIYYAVSYLLAEYRRKEHGNVSEQRLEMWINESDKLGMGFSAVEIPDRIFFMIAKCASSHTKYGFEPVMDLHQEDSGYAHDYVHPRFVAVLLQLGDALDMDNDRFHPLIKEFAGKMPEMSELHYKKHKSIRRLRINNQKITISADCENQDVLRLVRQEYGIIREILEKASYYWSVIRPKGASVGLPSLDKANLLLNGKEVPEELVEARFEIPQEKAFHLLEGNNIYIDENFVFLRELLQNAVDATKIQFYRDCKRQICRVIPEDNSEKTLETYIESPRKIKEILSPRQYPIEIKLIMAKRKAGVCEEINKEDVLDPKEKLKEYECGVLVTIQDFGTGISTGDIKKIADVGSSYESRKNEIKKMPQWLQPTGTFGIGLQSAFLADSRLIAKTFTRDGDNYVIEFSPRRTGANGYINVTPSNEINEDRIPYGTCFEIFVPHSRKKLHRDSMETWEGTDPFIASYDYNRPIRHTRELIKQMAYYLADMVGEPLFPINLFINDTYERVLKEKYRGKSGKHEFYSHYGEVFQQKFKDSGIRVYVNGSSLGNEDDGNKKKEQKKYHGLII